MNKQAIKCTRMKRDIQNTYDDYYSIRLKWEQAILCNPTIPFIFLLGPRKVCTILVYIRRRTTKIPGKNNNINQSLVIRIRNTCQRAKRKLTFISYLPFIVFFSLMISRKYTCTNTSGKSEERESQDKTRAEHKWKGICNVCVVKAYCCCRISFLLISISLEKQDNAV